MIVGGVQNNQAEFEAAVWRLASPATGLSDLPGGISVSSGRDISGNGRVVVGQAMRGERYEAEAFYWAEQEGMVGMGYLGDAYNGAASNASYDGSVIVGDGTPISGARRRFRWTAQTGMVGLGDLPGGAFHSSASVTSSDGSIVPGSSSMGIFVGDRDVKGDLG